MAVEYRLPNLAFLALAGLAAAGLASPARAAEGAEKITVATNEVPPAPSRAATSNADTKTDTA